MIDGNAHGIALLGNLMDAHDLIFIDIDTELKPGTVALEKVEGELSITDTTMLDAHRASPSLLVGYLRAMKAFNGTAYVIAIGPRNTEPFKPVSNEALNAVSTALKLLSELLSKYGLQLRYEGDPKDAIIECYRDALGY